LKKQEYLLMVDHREWQNTPDNGYSGIFLSSATPEASNNYVMAASFLT